jgi:Helix-turn-helix domain
VAAHYLRLNPRSIYLLTQRGAIPASRVTGKWLFPVHLLDDWIETSARGRGRVRGAPPASDLALPEGGLFLAGSDDPALEILPDALRGQADTRCSLRRHSRTPRGLAALGEGRADVAACAHVEAASGESDLCPASPPACPRIATPARTADLNNLSPPTAELPTDAGWYRARTPPHSGELRPRIGGVWH